MSHVSHLSPSFVISVGGVWVTSIVRALAVQFGIVWMIHVVLDFSLKSTHVLSMDLECKSPESTFPNHTCLSVFNSDIVFIIYALRADCEVEVSNIEPKTYHHGSTKDSINLEPTF